MEEVKDKIATRVLGSIIYANLALPDQLNSKSQISTLHEQVSVKMGPGWEQRIRETCFQLLLAPEPFKIIILADLDCLFTYKDEILVEVHHQSRVHSHLRNVLLSILKNGIKVMVILPAMFGRDDKFEGLFNASRNLARSLIADDTLQIYWRESSLRLFSGLDWLCQIRTSGALPVEQVLDYDATGNVISWGKDGYKELSLFISQQIVGWGLDHFKGDGHVKRGTALYLIQPISASECDDLLKGAISHLCTPFFKGSISWGPNIQSHVKGMVISRSIDSVLGNGDLAAGEGSSRVGEGQSNIQKPSNPAKRKSTRGRYPSKRGPPPGSTLLGSGRPHFSYQEGYQDNWYPHQANYSQYEHTGFNQY